MNLLLAREEVAANSRDNVGWVPLSYAAANGHEGVVKLLLGKDGIEADLKINIVNYDKTARIPLSVAAQNGHVAIVKLLLENGVDPESKVAYD